MDLFHMRWAPDNKIAFVKSLLYIGSLIYTGNGSLNYESIQSRLVHRDKMHYSFPYSHNVSKTSRG